MLLAPKGDVKNGLDGGGGAPVPAPQYLVEVLAREIGARGITVNSILPTATEGAGVSAKEVRPQVREFIKNNNPMQRMATLPSILLSGSGGH